MLPRVVSAASLEPHLRRCCYGDALLKRDYVFGCGRVALAAFADTPFDARSVCIAVVESQSNPEAAVADTRSLGAPVVFACHENTLQWWKQTTSRPVLIQCVDDSRHVPEFFRQHKDDFDPLAIIKGKTRCRLPGQTQLSFVDAGLMPFVERADGRRLSSCVEASFLAIESALGRTLQIPDDARNAIKATFWLLAAKALHDKEVDCFKSLDLTNIDDVFDRVGRHYGVSGELPPRGKGWRDATARVADQVILLDSLRNLSTESLAHVYENALVTKEVRKENGIHSTPGHLVDYMVWQLWPWIEMLDKDRRYIFEPACGHAAFLVGALRVLRQWTNIDGGKARHEYLKKHLCGIERDVFAREVARLSLTLADIPYGNKWNLNPADMFLGTALEDGARQCGVLLANPPYEKFTKKELADYAKTGVTVGAQTKACEVLRRTIPHLTEGACFGVVTPRGLLDSHEGVELRRTILSDFELGEIDILEDKLFEKADHESVVLLGRRKAPKRTKGQVWYRWVRNADMVAFRDRFAFSSQEHVSVSRFDASGDADLRVPEYDAIWRFLSSYPVLDDIADAGQGFSFLGKDLPKNTETLCKHQKPGYKPCFVTSRGNRQIFETPVRQWMNPSAAVIQSPRRGLNGVPGQVLVNHARASRGQWCMKAWLDQEGIAVKGNFLVVRPKEANVPGVVLWALLNGPVANAFIYCLSTKMHIIGSDLLRLPIPQGTGDWMGPVISAAQAYLAATISTGGFFRPDPDPATIKAKLLAMDAAVLQAYDLPPRLERQLLDLFGGVQRKGVGCTFAGYYPVGFSSCLPLHMLLSEDFERARADLTIARFKPGQSDHILEALAAATADRDEE